MAYEYYISIKPPITRPAAVEVEHLRCAAFHGLAIQDIERVKRVLYDEFSLVDILTFWLRYDLLLPIQRQEYALTGKIGNSTDLIRSAEICGAKPDRVGQIPEGGNRSPRRLRKYRGNQRPGL